MSTTHTCSRVADVECPTCKKMVPVIEHRYVSKGAFGVALGDWSEKTVTMVDREVHCDNHYTSTRIVTR